MPLRWRLSGRWAHIGLHPAQAGFCRYASTCARTWANLARNWGRCGHTFADRNTATAVFWGLPRSTGLPEGLGTPRAILARSWPPCCTDSCQDGRDVPWIMHGDTSDQMLISRCLELAARPREYKPVQSLVVLAQDPCEDGLPVRVFVCALEDSPSSEDQRGWS